MTGHNLPFKRIFFPRPSFYKRSKGRDEASGIRKRAGLN
jgi:hypothetical protein